MKWITAAILLFAHAPVLAGDVFVNIYGFSIHPHPPSGSNPNGDNLGWGLKYHFNQNFYIDGGRFIDSDRQKSRYVGAALQTSNEKFLSAGLEAFYMKRPNYRHGEPFWAALPFLACNIGRVTTVMGYIPNRTDHDYRVYETYFIFWSIKL